MDILIKNMEMPKSCADCEFCETYEADYSWCYACTRTGKMPLNILQHIRPSDCPLIELPEHGDLVNLGDVYEAINREIVPKGIFLSDFYKAFADIPTVLEASNGYNN